MGGSIMCDKLEWSDMPEPHSICKLSWEDIYNEAISQKRNPIKEDIIEMMNYLDSTRYDCNVDFNSWLEYRVQQYYEDKEVDEP